MMNKQTNPTFITLCLVLFFQTTLSAQSTNYSLADFYYYDASLAYRTDSVFNSLNDTTRTAQMIITPAGELGKSDAVVKKLVRENKVGGVLYLRGTKEAHRKLIEELNEISRQNNSLMLLNSMDAEPSLFNGRIKGTEKMMKTIDIKTVRQSDSIALTICKELNKLGIHQNFAPVVDLSPDNAAITNRSFGSDPSRVVKLAGAFIESTQNQNIVATAKHFPGHGLVKGDTHAQSVYIDGNLQEIDIYRPLINRQVISVMVAHIVVKNNAKYTTEGLPSTCSRNIVTKLLKEELRFKGLIITDALNNMKAVTIIDKASLKASMAGCDMLLMPADEYKTIDWILEEMHKNDAYKQQVYQSVKKIIRLKICLGLI